MYILLLYEYKFKFIIMYNNFQLSSCLEKVFKYNNDNNQIVFDTNN